MPLSSAIHVLGGGCGSDRNTLWHCGVYEPGLTRATIHDGQMTETFRKVQGVLFGNHLERSGQGLGWEKL